MKRRRELTFIYYRRSVKKGKTPEGQDRCPNCGSLREYSRSEASLADEGRKVLMGNDGVERSNLGRVRQLVNRITRPVRQKKHSTQASKTTSP